jgi:hypothetical protein
MGIAYNTSIVRNGLVLHLDAANVKSYPGSGTAWNDLSGNSRNATMYNAGGTTYTNNPAGAPSYTQSNSGEFTFDGINDWGKFTQFTFTSNISVSTWIKTSSSSSSKGIISNCSGGPVYLVYGITDGKMWYYYYTTSWQTATSNAFINDNNWKNLVWTKTGTTMKMYINSVLDSTITLTGDRSGIMNSIGCGWGPCNSDSYGAGTDNYGQVFPGTISSILAHNRELSASEVSQNFNALRGRYGI